MHIESEVNKVAVSILNKVTEAQLRGAAFSGSEVDQIIKMCVRNLDTGNTIESLRTKQHGAVDEAIKHVKIMKTIKRLEGTSDPELGDAGGSQADVAGRSEEVKVNVGELKRIFGRARVRKRRN